jgi:hypothetical protein
MTNSTSMVRRPTENDAQRIQRKRCFRLAPVGVCLAVWLANSLLAADLTENLVLDGGMEEWQATGPQDG